MTMESQPNGFFVTCTDWAGMTTEVFGFSYNFGYGYPTPGWIGRWSHDEDNPRMYLPFEYKEIVVGIPFADIDEIGFTDEPLWINITLRDENVLKGELGELGEDSQRFTGKTEYGDFSLRVEKVRQVAFDHTQDKNAPRVRPDLNLTSAYTMSIKTWQGNQFILLNGCRSELKDNYQWTKMRNSFDVKIGESTNNVSFDKIKRIQFREKDKDEAQLTTTSGKTIDISLSRYIWLGGNLDPFGPARIKMSQVASFEISRTTQS